MKIFLIISTLIATILSYKWTPENDDKVFNVFQQFIKAYNRKYIVGELDARHTKFRENWAELSDKLANKRSKYFHGVTQFFDMTPQEFARKQLTLQITPEEEIKASQAKDNFDHGRNLQTLPAEVDFEALGKVTPIKNQGSCGSCWAFATMGILESQYLILNRTATATSINFSEQYQMNCDYNNYSCQGGSVYSALWWLRYNGGTVQNEDAFSYLIKNQVCSKSSTRFPITVNNFYVVSQSEYSMKYALYMYGPIASALNAGLLQTYKGGIIDFENYAPGTDCPNTTADVNHAVIIVGYGTENGVDYWKVKNSWGPTWGEKGYFRIARGKNMCGIQWFNYYVNVSLK